MSIILTFISTIFLSDYIQPLFNNKVYLYIWMYALNVYVYFYLYFQKFICIFSTTNTELIIIKNGNVKKTCRINQLNEILKISKNHDMILYKEKNEAGSKYKYNISRLVDGNLSLPLNMSSIKLIDIQITYNDIKYNIDFNENNYYINGNVLFDISFIKWILHVSHGVLLNDTNYICTIMDQNINTIIFDSSKFILIENDSYSLCNYVIDKEEKNKTEENKTEENTNVYRKNTIMERFMDYF
jgi:hypothetical protein